MSQGKTGTTVVEKKSKLMGLWTLCEDAKEAIGLRLELSKSRSSSKKTTSKLDDQIIEDESQLIELQSNLNEVEAVVGTAWCPLKVIQAKRAIVEQEELIEDNKALLKEVEDTIKEYIG